MCELRAVTRLATVRDVVNMVRASSGYRHDVVKLITSNAAKRGHHTAIGASVFEGRSHFSSQLVNLHSALSLTCLTCLHQLHHLIYGVEDTLRTSSSYRTHRHTGHSVY
jgi:hypothetical protein